MQLFCFFVHIITATVFCVIGLGFSVLARCDFFYPIVEKQKIGISTTININDYYLNLLCEIKINPVLLLKREKITIQNILRPKIYVRLFN